MIIKILGTGCPKCKQLEENAKKAVEAGVNAIVSGSFIWQHKGGAKEAIGELNKVVTSNG